MFKFPKNSANLLAKESSLIENEVLKSAILNTEELSADAFGGFGRIIFERIFERIIIIETVLE